MVCAVFWDFGGVITTSPFEAFARHEEEAGLPPGFIRGLNAKDHHANAWAKLERNEVTIDEFCSLYESEARRAGQRVDPRAVLGCLAGDVRPEMVAALRAIRRHGLRQACLTNNFTPMDASSSRHSGEILAMFDAVIESSKVGVRKPEPDFYRIACNELGVAPDDAVMLDDLGVNLKPAREMGITTIKVVDPARALGELGSLLGFPLS